MSICSKMFTIFIFGWFIFYVESTMHSQFSYSSDHLARRNEGESTVHLCTRNTGWGRTEQEQNCPTITLNSSGVSCQDLCLRITGISWEKQKRKKNNWKWNLEIWESEEGKKKKEIHWLEPRQTLDSNKNLNLIKNEIWNWNLNFDIFNLKFGIWN